VFNTAFKENHVVITMNRPPVNAINREWISALEEILDEIGRRNDIAVLHLRSAQAHFSAGADLKLMQACFSSEASLDDMVETVRRLQRLYDRIEALPQVTLAEIDGSAFGGGLELALACDLRVCTHEARLGLPEAALGLLPGAGGTQRLTRLCGPGQARKIILTSAHLSGNEALDAGLVQWSVPKAEIAEFTESLVIRIARSSASALAACKRCLAVADGTSSPGMQVELLETYRLFHDTDTRSRVSNFINQRGQ
jgi:enoyl-CoA hydratase/carnithine racemase